MSDPITFKRDGDKVTAVIDLKACLNGRLSTGRAGASGQATMETDGKRVRLNLNVFQAGKAAVVAQL